MKKNAITPTRDEDYAQWYQQVIKKAELAEHSCVRGCMVILPWGYGIWENIQKILDDKFKQRDVQNAYFPLFIPLSYFEKEAEHVEGFAKECAIVTHHKLEQKGDGKLVPSGELDEPLIIRPTSEMVIGDSFSKWIKSYRDLPLKINQWANIVRWEMRPRLFLRSMEFLWQEGHTAHETEEEAKKEAIDMLHLYRDFSEKYLAIPAIMGEKTQSEKFPGAVSTYCIESMMQDKKALQAGTTHFFGQKFAKASNIKFSDRNGDESYAWTTSWGVATRFIGSIIMVHSDDDGLVLPPAISPSHIVILPILHDEKKKNEVLSHCKIIKDELTNKSFMGRKLSVIIDDSDMRGGEKKWKWVKKGIPIRIEMGPRDIENNCLSLSRRDKAKSILLKKDDNYLNQVIKELEEMQKHLFDKAKEYLDKNTKEIHTKEEFYNFFSKDNQGGFAICYWSEDSKAEEKIQNDLSVTPRCIPMDMNNERGECIFTKKEKTLKR